MKDLDEKLAKRFLNVCDDIKNAKSVEDLMFHVGVACGFASELFLSNAIDVDCHTSMFHHIGVMCDEWHLKEDDR